MTLRLLLKHCIKRLRDLRMESRMKLLVATHNRGKLGEFRKLLDEFLAGREVTWLALDDVGIAADVEETGQTFEENAVLKAQAYAAEAGLITLADDSGLVIDALGGAPGVYTARYGGPGLSIPERYQLVLAQMADVPWEERTARFVCSLAAAGADGTLLGAVEGVCEGMITWEAAGEYGFGYDPIFYLPDRGLTMAQLPPEEKQWISHRGRALRAIRPLLQHIVEQEQS